MARVSQIVALALAAALLLAPAAALAQCWVAGTMADSMASMPCCRSAVLAKGAHTKVTSEPAPCCKVQSGKPGPAPVAHKSSNVSVSVQPAAATVAFTPVVAAKRAQAPECIPISPHSPQAVLCTFLI